MKSIFSLFKKKAAVEVKENPVGAGMIPGFGQKIGGAKEGQALIKDGYARNAIVYSAIRRITTAVSTTSFDLYIDEKIVEDHPILDLLKRPNPMQGQADFLIQNFTNLLLTGEMFFSKAGLMNEKEPRELWPLMPLEISISPGRGGIPAAYIHKKNNVETTFPVNPVDGTSDVFFYKLYNPGDYWRGQPPIRAAALSADAHNEGLNWNYNLMRKGAKLSGYIKAPGGYPDASVLAKLKEYFSKMIQGSDNAGEIPVLSGMAEYVPFESNARDMDFIAGLKEYAKYVASVFGVPLPLIDNDAASMNNMEQAKEMLWTDTVIPTMNLFLDSFNAWLSVLYGRKVRLEIDMDAIPALEALRARKTERTIKAKDAGLISINEARDEIGYDPDPSPNADKLFVNGGLMPLDMADAGYDPTAAKPGEEDPDAPNPDPDDEDKPKEVPAVKPAK